MQQATAGRVTAERPGGQFGTTTPLPRRRPMPTTSSCRIGPAFTVSPDPAMITGDDHRR